MSKYRFFLNSDCFFQKDIVIKDPSIVHQMARVLRLQNNDEIICLDNKGYEYSCVIKNIDKKTVLADIKDKIKNTAERKEEIYIYQAIPKSISRFEFVLQKGTELGVKGFVPLITKRTERDRTSNIDRLKKIIQEAGEQSCRGILPVLEKEMTFQDAISNVSNQENLIAYEGEEKIFLKDIIPSLNFKKRINIFIGPEGGLDSEEIEIAKNNHFHVFSLGKLILRTETAGIAVVSRMCL